MVSKFDQSHKRLEERSFNQTLALLKKKLPAAFPVKIRYGKYSHLYAEVNLRRQGGKYFFFMKFDTQMCEDLAISILMHEWAHIISWPIGTNWKKWMEDHGPEWGVASSRVYQVLVEK